MDYCSARVPVDCVSRELVAKVLLACAHEPRTEGLTFNLMNGEGRLEAEMGGVVEGQVDVWTG